MKREALIKTADEPGALQWQEWPDPDCGSGDVVVRVERAAVCSTDVAIWDASYRGRQETSVPAMVGHEAAGTVVAAGPRVDGVGVGDRVALQVIWGHPQSRASLNGHENLDPDWFHLGTARQPGAFAELIALPGDKVVKLPDSVGWDDAALVESFSIAVSAMELVRLSPGETFVMVGPGTFGLMAAQIARASGARRVIAIGIEGTDQARLDVSERTGATDVVRFGGDIDRTADVVRELTDGEGANVVVDNGGTAESTILALEVAAAGARVALTGFTRSAEISPFRQIIRKGLTIHGIAASQRRHYGPALRMIEAGIRPSEIISHRMPLEEACNAMELMSRREATKVLLVAGESW